MNTLVLLEIEYNQMVNHQEGDLNVKIIEYLLQHYRQVITYYTSPDNNDNFLLVDKFIEVMMDADLEVMIYELDLDPLDTLLSIQSLYHKIKHILVNVKVES